VLVRSLEAGTDRTQAGALVIEAPFLDELIRYQPEEHVDGWHLQFAFDSVALPQLPNQRLGRTGLLTNHPGWSAEQVVAGYARQQAIAGGSVD
jgi:hypothetical protein